MSERSAVAPGVAEFIDAYIECALWSSSADDGAPLDDAYSADDIAPESREAMETDCLDFLTSNPECMSHPARAGADFWLTRNRHGAGFWDGDWPPRLGRDLTRAAHAYGSSDLYVGDDNKVHVS